MGRNAKFYKRVHKKLNASNGSGSASISPVTASAQSQAQAAKKRATLKEKTTKGSRGNVSESNKDGILGGADYVALMMGGRAKAKREADKLISQNI